MKNMLLENVEYKIEETPRGVWRRFVFPTGELFEEFTSHSRFGSLPFLHYTRGRCPETGKRVVAKGFIAIGRIAVGVIAIGHAAFGIVAVGQLALGAFFGLGQLSSGVIALGQMAIGGLIGLGQVVTGYVAVGQIGLGAYVLAQFGIGPNVWDMRQASPAAQQFFRALLP